MSAEEAYEKIQSMDCKKLQELIPMQPQDELIGENPRSIFEQSDDDKKSVNNINSTLDHLVSESDENEIILVCGSFFIMTDVR